MLTENNQHNIDTITNLRRSSIDKQDVVFYYNIISENIFDNNCI